MGFKITSLIDSTAYAGQIITYKIQVLPGITSNWVTEITQVVENKFFIDEQRFGPYRMWHHEHRFTELPSGKTVMEDKITYKMPWGVLGHLVHALFVKKQLTAIFNHRYTVLKTRFNAHS